MSSTALIFTLTDDIILSILFNLEDDPKSWSSLACVCTKFSYLIKTICIKTKCLKTIPSITSDLLHSSSSLEPPGGWASLFKLSVCCPGLHHAGVLLDYSDFGLERDIGPDENFQQSEQVDLSHFDQVPSTSHQECNLVTNTITPCNTTTWTLYDDLYFDNVYDVSEMKEEVVQPVLGDEELSGVVVKVGDFSISNKKRQKCTRSIQTHLATGVWNLNREPGNKLLASRFKGDCLYICDWPGCVHTEEKRSYKLFRGVFKNFKKSQAWRTINDGNRSKISLDCAFCNCKETWDLHSAFCLEYVFGFHDDGEPAVRAYVCENGHVSGAWTDRPMYF